MLKFEENTLNSSGSGKGQRILRTTRMSTKSSLTPLKMEEGIAEKRGSAEILSHPIGSFLGRAGTYFYE